jgi:putative MATE family efflux protein
MGLRDSLMIYGVSYMEIVGAFAFFQAISLTISASLKSADKAIYPMLVVVVVNVLNIIGNYSLIFGKFGMPRLGVAGAAVGTICARTLEIILNLYFAFRSSNEFRGSVRSYFGWDRELVRRVIKNATPTTINEFLWSLGQTMYVAAYNRIGTTAYAAYQAANSIFNIFSFASFSIGDAALILIGEKLGEGDKEYAWRLSRHIIKVGITVGFVIGAITIATAMPLSGLFKLSEQGRMDTFHILIVFGATMFIDVFGGLMITGVLRAGGDTRFAMFAECSTVWFVAVPMAFIAALVLHLPIHLAVLLTRTESVVKAAILLHRYRSGKWVNTVIEDL